MRHGMTKAAEESLTEDWRWLCWYDFRNVGVFKSWHTWPPPERMFGAYLQTTIACSYPYKHLYEIQCTSRVCTFITKPRIPDPWSSYTGSGSANHSCVHSTNNHPAYCQQLGDTEELLHLVISIRLLAGLKNSQFSLSGKEQNWIGAKILQFGSVCDFLPDQGHRAHNPNSIGAVVKPAHHRGNHKHTDACVWWDSGWDSTGTEEDTYRILRHRQNRTTETTEMNGHLTTTTKR